MHRQKMKAVGFDYGNTLTSSGMPMNWKDFYREALTAALAVTNSGINPDKLAAGEKILFKYNTRVNERDWEVTSDTVFTKLFTAWGITGWSVLKPAKDAFYSFFFNKTEVYPETESVLKELKKKNIKIGVLTNTAYGADKEYLIGSTPQINQYFDVCLASTEVGFRKPHSSGFLQLMQALQVQAGDCLFVGDEPVDVIGANKAGMVSVLINRSGEKRDYGQKYTVNSLTEILELV
ncbi:MAG: HAD family hydrolase [Dehalococcoidales bacterium]